MYVVNLFTYKIDILYIYIGLSRNAPYAERFRSDHSASKNVICISDQ